VFVAMTGDIYI